MRISSRAVEVAYKGHLGEKIYRLLTRPYTPNIHCSSSISSMSSHISITVQNSSSIDLVDNIVGNSATAFMYKNPKTNKKFGVAIRTHAQVFGIGAAPVWKVYYRDALWKKVAESSATWELPAADAEYLGVNVRIQPTVAHQKLKLLVTFTRLVKKIVISKSTDDMFI